jgi:hypothetical protein
MIIIQILSPLFLNDKYIKKWRIDPYISNARVPKLAFVILTKSINSPLSSITIDDFLSFSASLIAR